VGFFAFFVVLLLDQARPLAADDRLRHWFGELVDLVRSSTDAGQPQQGWIGWAVVAVSVCGVVLAVEWLAGAIHPFFQWLFHVLVLYLVIGFRQTAVVITEMQVSLALDDGAGARKVFDRWRIEQGVIGAEGPALAPDASIDEVCRETIVTALVNLHRGICAPLTLGAGACCIGPARAGSGILDSGSCRLWRGRSPHSPLAGLVAGAFYRGRFRGGR
jgi:cobalamin biosynthesis protein CobD/CbiB